MEIETQRSVISVMTSQHSVLADLGEEITGVVGPVSLCMALTVLLVRLLNPDGESNSGAVYLASAFYEEEAGDSTSTKLSGAVINAIIFVSIIGFMTFIMVLLFKYGCTKFIYAYMGFAAFSIFFVLTGVITLQLLQKADVELDWISFTYMLYNFAVVGSVTLFFMPAPLLMKQCYLIITGVAVAYVFTWIPEWTTWILLVAMALYDILAVLLPGGPLKVLVELAQERDEDIPALVYQARSSRRVQRDDSTATYEEDESPVVHRTHHSHLADTTLHRDSPTTPETPLISATIPPVTQQPTRHVEEPASNGRAPTDNTTTIDQAAVATNQQHDNDDNTEEDDDDDSEFGLPDAIKLGLGDFIFYSVLVGRAAMYNMLTVFACYLAIVAGLGCTLIWLALAHKALPALPISIALAVSFYFISRFVMEPVVLPMALQLVYF